ncbi:MAG: ABC transporter ATP-binding protein [Planctomycetes bacterium]|nr:ABC transporter ATP-binding protein [Planctomycetota bacterium]MCB9890908.1 ABC transporter ATP-binding protein [Planctomycetota bacterium]
MSTAQPALRVRALRCTYGEFVAVHELSLEIQPGEVFGLLGPNGAGKSTSVRSIVGLMKPAGGSIEIAGVDLGRDPVEAKRHLGYVPEIAALYEPLTPHEHLMLVGRLHGLTDSVTQERGERLLELLHLPGVLHAPMATFSKGMRQKVLLASALLHDPAVLVLDEPLTGLDAETTALVKELLKELVARGKAVLYTSHILDVVERVCTRMAIVNQGRIVAEGALADLRERAGSHADLDEVFRILTAAEDPAIRARAMLDAVR